ncbi:MAG: aldehyde dehydrogenase (NADP(+)) [Phycisphaerae bacterium]|nr:aldehyde dehydrogenase (NADP(+)) [Phycisphaerae bacterium]
MAKPAKPPAVPAAVPTALPALRRTPAGLSIIAGVLSKKTGDEFRATSPTSGEDVPTPYFAASPADVEAACRAAWEAFFDYRNRPAAVRAAFLEKCAENIVALGDDLIAVATTETGLAPARLVSERDRTVNQLRLFAGVLREGSWVNAAIDHGDANRRPLPKPDVRRILRPLGPVAVFGASNFPLAYSTAGGDTASALAAGCPVIVKGHPAHPGTGELVAHAITAALSACKLPAGAFSFLHAGAQRETAVGLELVTHPCIRAVGFTGSPAGGLALAHQGAARPDPIPVFAEMGSVNPVFLLPNALESQATSIAEKLAASITNSSGQMCTCPGLLLGVRGDGLEVATRAIADQMNQLQPQTMLSRRIRAGFIKRTSEIAAVPGVQIRGGSPEPGHRAQGTSHQKETAFPVRCSATLFRTNFETFKNNPTLLEECFGPAAVLVVCENEDQLVAAASMIQGSLTASIFAGAADAAIAGQLLATLELRAGRIVFNGVPTGVEVCAGMVHGGPFPATNQPHTTAVGHHAIERWCRPVCYQNAPSTLLPPELREENLPQVRRRVDGVWIEPAKPLPAKDTEKPDAAPAARSKK